MKLRHITPLLAAAGAAAAIVAAPTAFAATSDQSCTTAGFDTVCSSPGNVQINDSPPVQFAPQYPYWEGDYFGGYGGGHAGGHR